MSPPPSRWQRSKQPDYSALYQPPEPEPINPEHLYQTAGYASIAKYLKQSRHMLTSVETGQCLLGYLDVNEPPPPSMQPSDRQPSGLLDDEYEEVPDEPERILNPPPANISSSHRHMLLGEPPQAHAPQRRVQWFAGEVRVIGWVLRSMRSMRLAWLLRTEPLPAHYVRLIRRADFDWLEPLLPESRRLSVETTAWPARRDANAPTPAPADAPADAHRVAADGWLRRGSCAVARPDAVAPPVAAQGQAHAGADNADDPPSWLEIVAAVAAVGADGGAHAAGRHTAATPPWQQVAHQERRCRRLPTTLAHCDATVSAERLLVVLRRICADGRERLFHIYDHRVQRLDADRRRRLAHKYLSVRAAGDAGRGLRKMRADVAARVRADRPSIMPARWYHLLEKRAEDLRCGPEVLAVIEEAVGPFITDELSTFSSAGERLCLLVMSLPVYELMSPRWQQALLFVLVEVLQHHEGLLHAWLASRRYPDHILKSM